MSTRESLYQKLDKEIEARNSGEVLSICRQIEAKKVDNEKCTEKYGFLHILLSSGPVTEALELCSMILDRFEENDHSVAKGMTLVDWHGTHTSSPFRMKEILRTLA